MHAQTIGYVNKKPLLVFFEYYFVRQRVLGQSVCANEFETVKLLQKKIFLKCRMPLISW